MKHRVLSVFLALMVVLFSVRVPDVDADEDILTGDKLAFGKFESYEELHDNLFLSKIGVSIDDYYFIFFGPKSYEPSVSTNGITVAYIAKDDYKKNYLSFSISSESDYTAYNYSLDLSYFTVASLRDSGVVNYSYSRYDFSLRTYNSGVNAGVLVFDNALVFQNSSSSVQNAGIYTNLDINAGGVLNFTYDNDFSVGMDLTTLPQQFTLTATNETNNYYNYVFYISLSPASAGVQKSFSDAVYIMSSTQWCMKYSWSSLIPGDDVSISDWVKDAFGRVLDPWGNIFNVDDSYMGRHGSGSSGDGIYYYTLSQQKKCPFYLIKPQDSRAHVIPYSVLNLEVGKTYYANIIYLDTTDYGVIPSSNSWGAADTIHNNYREHPLYNLNLISRFSVYSSIEFSVVNGNFTKDGDGLYDYKDVVDNSNPASSSATISSDDNSVSINNANSYDNSSTVSYINYGTIYHNCTWGSSGAGGSGSSIVAPTVPEFDFDQLTAGCGNFLKFVKHVFFECLPEIFTTMLLAAFAVVIYCRVWGR